MRFLSLTTPFTVLLSTFCLANSAIANTQTNSINTASSTNHTLSQAQTMQQSAERQLGQQSLTNHEDKWSEWGMTRQDWTRYEELKQGARGIWTPNLDPLTMLGVEARNSSERDRMAELLAKKEYERVQKELDFQIAYTKAFERLYPNQLPFRVDESGNAVSSGNRVIFFTRSDCGQKCDENLKRLLGQLGQTPLDIYVVDSEQQDEKIRQWAMTNQIDVAKVRSRQITLNHDSGYWLKYAKGKMPAAFQIRGDGEWQPYAY